MATAGGTQRGWLYQRFELAADRMGRRLNEDIARSEAADVRRVRRPLILWVLSALVTALALGLLALSVWLIVTGGTSALLLAGGAAVLAVAIRPRLGRLRTVKRRGYAVSAAQAPALHVLIDQVAAATGNLRPDVVLLTRYPEISAVVVGLRSHRVLLLGLPILITLTAQERVALIGSALAQTTPARVRAARAIQPGLSLLRGVAVAFRPMCIREWAFPVRRPLSWWCWQFLGAPLWVPACLAHLVAVRLTAAERRRWQLRSDLVAMRASGTIGMLGALNELALWPHYAELVNGWVPPGEALPVWRKRIDAVRASRPADLDTLRAAANARDGSVRAGTLPIGHRYDFLVEQPYEAPQLLVAANHAARIDAELAPYAEALRRRLTDGYEPYVPPLRGAGSAAWTHRSVTGRLELFDRRPPRP